MSATTLAWRHFRLERKMFWRNPTAAFFSFVLPLIFLVLFGAISDQANLKIIVPGHRRACRSWRRRSTRSPTR